MLRTATTRRNQRFQIQSATNRPARRPTIFVMISLLVLGLAGLLARKSVVSSKAAVTVQAAGRGGLHFNMRDGRQMQVDYRGEQYVTESLRSGAAQPRSLASMDMDGDATPDLIAGYVRKRCGSNYRATRHTRRKNTAHKRLAGCMMRPAVSRTMFYYVWNKISRSGDKEANYSQRDATGEGQLY